MEERRGERVAIGGGRGLLAANDLRGHVGDRAQHRARRGDGRVGTGSGQAEVGQERLIALVHEHVLRLDVAVDEARLVRRVERDRSPDRAA